MFAKILKKIKNIFFKIQSPKEIEEFYKKEDPWGYKRNESDKMRKRKIIGALELVQAQFNLQFKKALDIGCGEGWLTEDLPAEEVIGIDISKTAIERANKNNRKGIYFAVNINKDPLPLNKFDLIITTGVLYPWYIKEEVLDKIERALKKGGIWLSCHIKEWNCYKPNLKIIFKEEFDYRDYKEELIIFKKNGE